MPSELVARASGLFLLPRSHAIDGSPRTGSGDAADRLAFHTAALLPRQLGELLTTIAMLAGTMAVSCGMVLVVRRFVGAIATPSGPEAMLAACGSGLVLVAVGDLTVRRAAAPGSLLTILPGVLTVLPGVLTRSGLLLAVTAVSLPLPQAPALDLVMAIATLGITGLVIVRGPIAGSIRQRLGQSRSRGANGRPPKPVSTDTTATPIPDAISSPPADDHETATPRFAGSLLQRFERVALPGGGECVRGRLCLVVPEGSRSGSTHMGFCPPFASVPAVEVTTNYDGVEAVVSAAEVLPWGIRIECRLDEPAEEAIEIPVDVVAHFPA